MFYLFVYFMATLPFFGSNYSPNQLLSGCNCWSSESPYKDNSEYLIPENVLLKKFPSVSLPSEEYSTVALSASQESAPLSPLASLLKEKSGNLEFLRSEREKKESTLKEQQKAVDESNQAVRAEKAIISAILDNNVTINISTDPGEKQVKIQRVKDKTKTLYALLDESGVAIAMFKLQGYPPSLYPVDGIFPPEQRTFVFQYEHTFGIVFCRISFKDNADDPLEVNGELEYISQEEYKKESNTSHSSRLGSPRSRRTSKSNLPL